MKADSKQHFITTHKVQYESNSSHHTIRHYASIGLTDCAVYIRQKAIDQVRDVLRIEQVRNPIQQLSVLLELAC